MAGRLRRLAASLALLGATVGGAEPLRLAVAANFQSAFARIEGGFAEPLQPAYGSSGLLHAQIVQGRPFDVFLSADKARPMALVRAGRAVRPVVYAKGRLALLTNGGEANAAWLEGERRVAIANPQTAPYGRAAEETLDALGARVQRITALNVAQAFHFAVSGAADGAFVALAQIIALPEPVPATRYWIVPEELYAPIEQWGVVVKGGNEAGAEALLDYLVEDGAQAAIRAAGYR